MSRLRLNRKQFMAPLADADIPVFPALGRRISEEAEGEDSIYDDQSSAG